MTTRERQRWRVVPISCALWGLAACGGGLPSGMGTPRPAPVPVPVPPPAVPITTEWRPRYADAPVAYRVRLEVRLARDSSGRRDEAPMTTSGRVAVRWPGNAPGRIEGRVSELTVSGSDRVVDSASTAARRAVSFDGVADSLTTRLSVVPPLANECDAPETTALSLAREVVVRWPSGGLLPGSMWRDSSATFSCRGGVPITTRVRARALVKGTSEPDQLDVVRTTELELSGDLKQAWRAVRLRGRGTGETHIIVSRQTGQIVRVDGITTTEVIVTDPTRGGEQKITQRVTVRAEREP
jgi:hypothetical protein